ncbi:prepilin-type N-terminal cleavage/methylation domain-containing protein [Candidatus Giovannonibacteria bacterium]|nr:prepilin-type N-terminal cleavage/methylation domain-containing protein [Candidatus Giovannonibacteria bacterium]
MRGLTLLEILISLAIILIAGSILAYAFSGFRANSELSEAQAAITGMLQEARSRTLASENATTYGVHFEAERTVLFAGSSYNAADPSNKEYVLPTRVSISAINIAGGVSDIIFARLSGRASATGTMQLLTKDTAKSKTINILSAGIAE